MTKSEYDKSAPMASAPFVHNTDGSVAWDRMWDSFCALASTGGPAHRPTMLSAQEDADPNSATYQGVVAEIVRGITLVSGLQAFPGAPGWVAIDCGTTGKATWLSKEIGQEGVQARCEGRLLFVPAGEHFAVHSEIKNVITVVAKTTHYWDTHLPVEVKRALAWEEKMNGLSARIQGWFRRK